jgi:hypothetical protein
VATFTFASTGYAVYHTDSGQKATGHGEYIYYGVWGDNHFSLVFFDSAAIRSALSGYTIQSITMTVEVEDVAGARGMLSLGTHNYTSGPTYIDWNRLVYDRLRYQIDVGWDGHTDVFFTLSLSNSIGQALKDGTASGILVGPVPSDLNEWDEAVQLDGTGADRPVLTIVATPANTAPYAPALQTPTLGAVRDFATAQTFSWLHSDPQGDAQGSYYFRRKKPDGSYDYWNGTSFQTTEVAVVSTAQSVTIPGGTWGTTAGTYYWSVATVDTKGAKGAYATDRQVFSSSPPVAGVVSPALTTASPRPTIQWTYSDVNGEAQYAWVAQIVPSETYNAAGYNPENMLGATWSGSGTGTVTSAVPTRDLVNHKTYRAYVKVASSPNPSGGLQYSGWSWSTFDTVVPPFPPTINYPQNGGIVDLAAGFTMDWTNSYFSNVGSQTAFAIRRLSPGGTLQWWNGATWISGETFLPGTQANYAFRPNEISNGVTYTFSVAIRDDYSVQSPYSSGNTVTGSTAAQVNVVQPGDVVVTTRPLVTWTVYDVENDPQQTYHVRIIDSTVYSGAGATFDPFTATAAWDSTETADPGGKVRNAQVLTDLLNNHTYRAYVRSKTSGIYSGWAYQEFSVLLQGPATPKVWTEPDDDTGTIAVHVQARDSLFDLAASQNDAGWEADTNATVANRVFYGSSQSRMISMMTATGGTSMSARTAQAYAVVPGVEYTAAVSVIAGATSTAFAYGFGTEPFGSSPFGDGVGGISPGAATRIELEFTDAGGAVVGRPWGNTVVDTTALRTSVTAIAPPTAAFARPYVMVLNSNPADVHGFFDPVMRTGEGNEWSPGGLNTGTMTLSIYEDATNRPLRRGLNVPIPNNTQKVIVVDEEAPIGLPQTYRVVVNGVYPGAVIASSPGLSDSARWQSGWLWLSDPLRPGTGRAFGPQSLGPINRPVRQGKFRPIGRPDAIVTTGTRGLREGSFVLVTWSREDREYFQALSDESETVLLRLPPDQGEDFGDAIYVRLEGDAPEERPLPSRTTHRTISQNWTEQRRPQQFLDYGA